jgi:transcriptional regulator with XRE-family HTH domain
MIVGERLKSIREVGQLSQGDIEKRTGLLRCYISRVENGHTIPSLETLEKMARALDIPMYQLFYSGDNEPITSRLPRPATKKLTTRDLRILTRLAPLLGRMKKRNKGLLLGFARKLSEAR